MNIKRFFLNKHKQIFSSHSSPIERIDFLSFISLSILRSSISIIHDIIYVCSYRRQYVSDTDMEIFNLRVKFATFSRLYFYFFPFSICHPVRTQTLTPCHKAFFLHLNLTMIHLAFIERRKTQKLGKKEENILSIYPLLLVLIYVLGDVVYARTMN